MNNKTRLLLLSMVWPVIAFAQGNNSLRGFVIDSISYEPLPYATVRLTDSANKIVSGAITDENGIFRMANVPQGSFSVYVSFVGYRSKHVAIKIEETETRMRIRLVPEAIHLEVVNVTGEKVTSKEEIDKTVFTIDNSLLENSPTALDVLKKIPGISVSKTKEEIRVNGNRNVLVLIDGAYTKRSLNLLTPEDIERVEVMTNPTVEFDSDVANVLNIVLKNESKKGFRLMTSLSGSYPTNQFSGNIGASYEFSKFKVFVNAYGVNMKEFPSNLLLDSTSTDFTDNITNIAYHEHSLVIPSIITKNRIGSLQFGLDYRPTKKDLISLTSQCVAEKYTNDGRITHSAFFANDAQQYDHQMFSTFSNFDVQSNISLYYRHKFNDSGREISFNSNLFLLNSPYSSFNRSTFYNIAAYPADVSENSLLYDVSQGQTSLNVKVKCDLPVGDKLKLSTGVQTYHRFVSSESIEDSLLSSRFRYRDVRLAGFGQISYKAVDWLTLMGGIRAEHLQYKSFDNVAGKGFNVLPSAAILFNLNESHSIRLNYKTLLGYPSYYQLTPFVFGSTDSLSVSYGNDSLRPQYTNRISVSYTFRKGESFICLSPTAAFSNNMLSSCYWIEGHVLNSSYSNLGKSARYSATLTGEVVVGGFLGLTFECDAGYVFFNRTEHNGWEYNYGAGIETDLPWDMSLVVMLWAEGMHQSITGNTWGSPVFDDFCIERVFLKGKLTASLDIANLLLAERSETNTFFEGYSKSNYRSYKSPYVLLKLRYVLKTGDRKIAPDEERETLIESEAAQKTM